MDLVCIEWDACYSSSAYTKWQCLRPSVRCARCSFTYSSSQGLSHQGNSLFLLLETKLFSVAFFRFFFFPVSPFFFFFFSVMREMELGICTCVVTINPVHSQCLGSSELVCSSLCSYNLEKYDFPWN